MRILENMFIEFSCVSDQEKSGTFKIYPKSQRDIFRYELKISL